MCNRKLLSFESLPRRVKISASLEREGGGNVLVGGIFSPWNFMSDLPPLHLSWNVRCSVRLQERAGCGQFWGPQVCGSGCTARAGPPPKRADTRQDLPEPMAGESPCKLLSGGSLRIGCDHEGQSMEVLQPRCGVEGFLEKVHGGEAPPVQG